MPQIIIPITSLSSLQDASIGHPTIPETNVYSRSVKIFPAECRERGATYKAKMSVTISWKVEGRSAGSLDKVVGHVPIMIKVDLHWEGEFSGISPCNLIVSTHPAYYVVCYCEVMISSSATSCGLLLSQDLFILHVSPLFPRV